MINSDFRTYNYFTFGDANGYGQQQLSETAQGTIKLAIYVSSQAIQDNINYKNANYIGLTQAPIDDSYVIEYGAIKLKVLYVNPQGKYKQVMFAQI